METRLIEQVFDKSRTCGCCLNDLWIGSAWLPKWSVISSRIASMNPEDKKNLYYEIFCELTRMQSIKTFSIETIGFPMLMGFLTTVVALFGSLQVAAISSAKAAGDAWDTLSDVLTSTFSSFMGYILFTLVLLLVINFLYKRFWSKKLARYTVVLEILKNDLEISKISEDFCK